MQRRDMLRSLLGACCAAGTLMLDHPWRPRFRIARAATGKTLVVLFQRGGCDGLNMVVPYGDDEYYRLRPTLAIVPPNAGNPASAVPVNGFFGLHPGLTALAPIYQAGNLAILPTVHYPNGSRSHFDGQAFLESGGTTRFPDGWLNRYLTTSPVSATLRAVGFGNTLWHSLRGAEVVSAFMTLDQSFGLPAGEEAALSQRLAQMYSQPPDLSRAYREDTQDFGQALLRDISTVRDLQPQQYLPANGAVYPDTLLGLQLRQTAQLIRSGVGLEVAALSMPRWDTHRSQGAGNIDGTHFQLFQEFAGALAAFSTDLGALMNHVIVLTMTEFGRTAAENGSGGTDHGNGCTWLAMGNAVRGGVYGAWPGLSPEQLYMGRYLQHTIDYRNVLGEVLSRHLSASALHVILPGHTYQPVGFL